MKFLILIAAVVAASCATTGRGASEPPYLASYRTKGLPALGPVLDFEHDSFPPVPKGLPLRTDVKVDAIPRPALSALGEVAKARTITLNDPWVISALGARYVVLSAGTLEADKEQAGPMSIAVHLYSYSEDRAYRVVVQAGAVASVEAQPAGYQPPETPAEVAAAAEVVRKDARYGEIVRLLHPRGLQSPNGRAHRQIYVMFFNGTKRPALFAATVDMVASRVVQAGPLPKRLP
jgi:hypothetical protein